MFVLFCLRASPAKIGYDIDVDVELSEQYSGKRSKVALDLQTSWVILVSPPYSTLQAKL
jgi:hypothetical protein